MSTASLLPPRALVVPAVRSRLLGHAMAALAGALLACAFAPLDLWPFAILSPAVLMWLWEGASPRRAAWLGLTFGAGTFGLGTWWLYVSLHDANAAPVWLSVALVLALVGIMAAYHALLGYLAARVLPATGICRWLLGLPGLWLVIEWLRGWFPLSGFPWLSLGYSQTDAPLAGFAPILGTYGISLLSLLGSGALLTLLLGNTRARIAAAVVLAAPWPIGAALARVPWTRPVGAPISVAVLQGAVPEDVKWQASNVEPTRELYTQLFDQALGARLIIWPEAALPQLANEIPDYLRQVYSRARRHGSDVLMGILRADVGPDGEDRYYDSIMTLANDVSFYDKHRLVPFAEYFPVPAAVRRWLRLMNLPYSDFTPGAASQPAVAAGGAMLSPSICYEDAFGSLNLGALRAATVLVNVTNDAWFGHTWARYQHLQIARMRAIEARRPLLRAANDGVSALIGPFGEVLARAPEYRATVLRGTVQPRTGLPPYGRLGNAPAVVLGLLGAGIAALRRRARVQEPGGPFPVYHAVPTKGSE